MVFTPAELEFLRGQRLGRLATVGPSGWPHVVPVMFALTDAGELEFDADGVKLRNLIAEPRVAFVVDASGPKRGVSVQGRAEVIGEERARLAPEHKFSWGL
ncbi:MAG: pyridoxamine 5'-phosphate oxidase family protein [Candidatus Eremiobacteraeota bacterium]|nr:pyridoxamine 5'-phosphate oxidase family protein [Candidatus Eremiobacteraeota bacterium]